MNYTTLFTTIKATLENDFPTTCKRGSREIVLKGGLDRSEQRGVVHGASLRHRAASHLALGLSLTAAHLNAGGFNISLRVAVHAKIVVARLGLRVFADRVFRVRREELELGFIICSAGSSCAQRCGQPFSSPAM